MNWYHFASLIVGYLLAAMFSSYVSLTLAATVWGSVWTYAVLAFWWFIALFITWLIPIVLFGGGILALLGILAGALGIATWWNDWTLRRKRARVAKGKK